MNKIIINTKSVSDYLNNVEQTIPRVNSLNTKKENIVPYLADRINPSIKQESVVNSLRKIHHIQLKWDNAPIYFRDFAGLSLVMGVVSGAFFTCNYHLIGLYFLMLTALFTLFAVYYAKDPRSDEELSILQTEIQQCRQLLNPSRQPRVYASSL